MDKAIPYGGRKVIVGPKLYRQIEDGLEVLQLTCGVCHKNLLKLKNPLFNRLFAVVSLQESPDGHKDRQSGDATAEGDDLLRSIQEGRPLAEVRAERQAKN